MLMRNLFVLFLVVFLWACGSDPTDPDNLVGTYSIMENGNLEEFLKIEKRDDNYVMSEKSQGDWRQVEDPIEKVTQEEFEELIEGEMTDPFVGLKSKGFAVFQVPEGWEEGGFKTDTGYFMYFLFGPVELHKT